MKECKEVVKVQMSAYPGNFRANAALPTISVVEVQEVDCGLEIVVKYQGPFDTEQLTVDRIWYSPDELARPAMERFEWTQQMQPVRQMDRSEWVKPPK